MNNIFISLVPTALVDVRANENNDQRTNVVRSGNKLTQKKEKLTTLMALK